MGCVIARSLVGSAKSNMQSRSTHCATSTVRINNQETTVRARAPGPFARQPGHDVLHSLLVPAMQTFGGQRPCLCDPGTIHPFPGLNLRATPAPCACCGSFPHLVRGGFHRVLE